MAIRDRLVIMQKPIKLQLVLDPVGADSARKLELFALLTLGIIESLENRLLSPAQAITVFFNLENCRFVRDNLPAEGADHVMGRGVQLPDLLDALNPEDAHKEFQREVAAIRRLCLGLLGEHRLVA
jgi:hypothetical protein